MSGLRLSNVTKSFGDFVAVDGFDLEVPAGEFITLLGPSGCGKTTTLRIIAGFLVPDRGEVLINGRLMNDVPPARRNTGMCFQSYALFPHMTVYENVRFGLRMKQRPGRRPEAPHQRASWRWWASQGLEGRKPAELSGGQQQRVALARAIVIEPDVLLFDEPLSNLDAKLREYVRVEIRNLQKRLGITSIYVTHDQAEALVISDRVVVMNRGRIEQVGDPFDVYRNPHNELCRRLHRPGEHLTAARWSAATAAAYGSAAISASSTLHSERPLAGNAVAELPPRGRRALPARAWPTG